MMEDLGKKLIDRIRESEDPDKMRDYIEDLLFNPQKLQEELAKHAALRGS